jgi:hypothetical protein
MNLSKFLITISLLAGCSPIEHPVSSDEIAGKYIASYHDSKDELLLLGSGKYEHSYYIDGVLVVDRESWEFLGGETSVDIRLFNFRFRNAKGAQSAKSDWIVSAEKSARISLSENINNELRIRLCFNYDLDHCFIQQNLGSNL